MQLAVAAPPLTHTQEARRAASKQTLRHGTPLAGAHVHQRRRASVTCRCCHPNVSEGEDGGADAQAGAEEEEEEEGLFRSGVH